MMTLFNTSVLGLIDEAPRHLFFTGKGGVGKTTLACAVAISLADRGKRVLLVSTDPASNLDDVLGLRLNSQPTPVPEISGLFALNIDPEAAAQAYRERAVGPYRGVLPDEAIRGMEEQLSGACTVEIAAFDEFTQLLTESDVASRFDHIVFDTAPTGHTLRLLALPAAWTGFLENNTSGTSCIGPSSALKSQQERYFQAQETLSDAGRTVLVLVARPEPGSLAEAERTSGELREQGMLNQRLIINGVFHASDRSDPVALALEERGASAMATLPAGLRDLPLAQVALQGQNMVGIKALCGLFAGSPSAATLRSDQSAAALPQMPALGDLVDQIQADGHGLVMVMGKGGVGKTTIAAALAVELASRGLPVQLTTTDPAAHIGDAVAAQVEGLTVSRIDPAAETRAYKDRVMERAGKDLDDAGRALLAEDLDSPCTEEVAVFHAFSHVVAQARQGFVVLDTAPTGHTLLLLDAAGSFHREVLRTTPQGVGKITTPLMRLRDASYTKVLIVTLAETTPVLETAALQEDLRRAEITPYAWIINSSLAAAHPRDPVLVSRALSEIEQIEKVKGQLAGRTFIVPWLTSPPVGPLRLRQLAGSQK